MPLRLIFAGVLLPFTILGSELCGSAPNPLGSIIVVNRDHAQVMQQRPRHVKVFLTGKCAALLRISLRRQNDVNPVTRTKKPAPPVTISTSMVKARMPGAEDCRNEFRIRTSQ